jgi:hypothetical protein
MRAVRLTLERPDEITASAASARDLIGRAVADKIRDTETADELKKVAEDVLPEIEKFLESPEERRLRRVRAGVVTSMIGIGTSLLALLLLSVAHNVPSDILNILVTGLGFGVITFFIGIGVILNAIFFTIPRKQLRGSSRAVTEMLDSIEPSAGTSPKLTTASPLQAPSITEHTTQHLSNKS